MCATRAVFILLVAAVACALVIPAALPRPQPVGAPASIDQRQPLENREVDPLAEGPDPNQDLKGSSSYGYGYYGGGHWGGYYPYYRYGYGYPYYGGFYGYPYYRSYYPYYYRPYGYGYWW